MLEKEDWRGFLEFALGFWDSFSSVIVCKDIRDSVSSNKEHDEVMAWCSHEGVENISTGLSESTIYEASSWLPMHSAEHSPHTAEWDLFFTSNVKGQKKERKWSQGFEIPAQIPYK